MDFIIVQGCGTVSSLIVVHLCMLLLSKWGQQRSTTIIHSPHISPCYSQPRFQHIFSSISQYKNWAVSQPTIFSIVTRATPETWGTMGISATNIFLRGRKRRTVLGISEWTNLALPTFSLSLLLCVFDLFLLWFHLQFCLRVCSVKQSSRSMLHCIVCPSVWVCVLYRLSSVIVWSYCDQMRQRRG